MSRVTPIGNGFSLPDPVSQAMENLHSAIQRQKNAKYQPAWTNRELYNRLRDLKRVLANPNLELTAAKKGEIHALLAQCHSFFSSSNSWMGMITAIFKKNAPIVPSSQGTLSPDTQLSLRGVGGGLVHDIEKRVKEKPFIRNMTANEAKGIIREWKKGKSEEMQALGDRVAQFLEGDWNDLFFDAPDSSDKELLKEFSHGFVSPELTKVFFQHPRFLELESFEFPQGISMQPGFLHHISIFFPNLKELNASGCSLEESCFEDLSKCKKLEVLILSENGIESIPESIQNFPALKTLDLSGNCLTDKAIPVLQRLVAARAGIQEINISSQQDSAVMSLKSKSLPYPDSLDTLPHRTGSAPGHYLR